MELLCLLRLLSAIAFYSAATAEQLSVAPKSARRCLIYLLLPRVDGRGGTFWLLVRDNQVPRGTYFLVPLSMPYAIHESALTYHTYKAFYNSSFQDGSSGVCLHRILCVVFTLWEVKLIPFWS